jgi:hypothetical protein
MNNSGAGDVSGTTYNGSAARTISYNTIGAIGGTLATGQVAFGTAANTVGGDNGLFWDNTNKRLGVGLNNPDVQFQVLSTLKVGQFETTNGTLEIASSQGPKTTFQQVGNNLNISNTTGAPIGTILFTNKLRTVSFSNDIGGTFRIPRANQGLLNSNTNGFLVENQTTTVSNSTATFISTSGSGSIIRSTSYGTTGVSADINFQFGGGGNPADSTITTPVIFKKSGNILINTTTDAGFRLDVNGTARVQGVITGSVTSGTLTLGAAAANTPAINISGFYVGSGAISTSNSNARSFNTVIGGQNNGIVLSYNSLAQGQTVFNSYFVASGNINLTDGAVDLNGFHFGPTIVSATGATIKAFSSGLSAATNRWNLFMSGSASNYLAGKLLIGSTTDVPSASVAITSTTQGFLPPRMTAAQRTAIASPAEGLIVYQTDSVIGLYIYSSSTWRSLTMV